MHGLPDPSAPHVCKAPNQSPFPSCGLWGSWAKHPSVWAWSTRVCKPPGRVTSSTSVLSPLPQENGALLADGVWPQLCRCGPGPAWSGGSWDRATVQGAGPWTRLRSGQRPRRVLPPGPLLSLECGGTTPSTKARGVKSPALVEVLKMTLIIAANDNLPANLRKRVPPSALKTLRLRVAS